MPTQTREVKSPFEAVHDQSVTTELIAFINHELVVEEEIQMVDADTPLLDMGLLDSLAMVSLLAFIERVFGVRIPDDAVVPEHFETPRVLIELVVELQKAQPGFATEQRSQSVLVDTVSLLESQGIERNTVELRSGERIHYLKVDGAEPTWVLLPGLGNPSSSWGMMLRSLAGEQAALAIDLPGFGLSTCPEECPTYADHFRVLDEVLKTVDKAPYILVGSSAGGLLATEFARRYPHRVVALVLTGFGLIPDVRAWWHQLMALSAVPENFLEAAYYRPPRQTDALRQAVADILSRPAYESFLNGGGFDAMTAAFEHIQVPTLLVAGEHDGIIPSSAVEAAVDRIAGAQLEWLARCGHFPPTEQPEELLYVIRRFLGRL